MVNNEAIADTRKQLNAALKRHEISACEFESLFELYFKRVYNFVSFRINNHHDTEDLVSHVFEKVIAKYATYNNDYAPIEAWIIGIAKNVVNDYYRKKKKRIFITLESIADFFTDHSKPDDIVLQNAENEELIKALNTLSQKERTMVAMKYAAQLKNKDIARIMGLSDSNTGVILHRCIEKLRKELSKMEGDSL